VEVGDLDLNLCVLEIQKRRWPVLCAKQNNQINDVLLPKNLKIKMYRTIILPVVLYGCETWSLTLRDESRPSFFENRMLRMIFESKSDEVTGEWRKHHNE
jgi:hypothetical protein